MTALLKFAKPANALSALSALLLASNLACASTVEVQLSFVEAYGYDFIPWESYNGQRLIFNDKLPTLRFSFNDQPVSSETFSFPWVWGDRIQYAVNVSSISSPFTALLPDVLPGVSGISLPLSDASLTFERSNSPGLPLGTTSLSLSLWRRDAGVAYALQVSLVSPRTSWSGATDFLAPNYGYTGGFKELVAQVSGDTITGGTEYKSSAFGVSAVHVVSSVPEPSAFSLSFMGLIAIGVWARRARGRRDIG